MNPTSKEGFHTLDPIRIYFRVRFLTTHNQQTCIIQIYTKFHTKIQRFILEFIPFFFSFLLRLSSSSLPLPLLLLLPFSSLLYGLFSPKMRPNLVLNPSSPFRPCLAPKKPIFGLSFHLFHFSPSIPLLLQIKLGIFLF